MKAHGLGQVGTGSLQDSESALAIGLGGRRGVDFLSGSSQDPSLFSSSPCSDPAKEEDLSSSAKADVDVSVTEILSQLHSEEGDADVTGNAVSRYDNPGVSSSSCASGAGSGSSLGGSGGSVPSVPSNGVTWCSALASHCSMKRTRRLWAAILPLGCFFYVVFYCNSAIWQTLNINTHPLDNIITGSGFRKLLQERARLLEKPHPPGAVQRLPQCIIIGVRKCGTRALLEFLNLHPNIATAEEEMHFFSADERYKLGLEWYRKRMPYTLEDQITIEKTPKYFISHVAPARIHRLNSSMKLIVLLRHPTTRVVSDYTQVYFNKQVKNETWDDFEKIAIDPDTGEVNTHYKAVQISIYHQFMQRWLSLFPRHQIHFVDGDQLIRDPVAEVVRVEEFLGLDHRVDYRRLYYNTTRGFYCMRVNQTTERCLGASKGRKHPKINPTVLRKLDAFFRPHNERLFRMIKRRFPWT